MSHVCEFCGNEIEGNFIKYIPKGVYFHRFEGDECFKNWLYEQTDGKCEYGTTVNGEEYEIEPSWTEDYLNSLGLSKKDF